MINILNIKEHKYSYVVQTLKLLNPLNILDKGYSVVYKDDKIVKDVDNLSVGDDLTIRFKSGSVITKVSKIDERKFI